MEELLFDDLLFGDLARKEHEQFRQVLGRVAEEVLDIQELFLEALDQDGAKLAFIEDLRRLVDLPDKTCNLLRDMTPRDVARSCITGLTWDDARMDTHWQKTFDYRLRPSPNLLFMRDPAAVLGHGYNINFMATWAREREPLILSYVFRHHPRLRQVNERDRYYRSGDPAAARRDQDAPEPGGWRHLGALRQDHRRGLQRADQRRCHQPAGGEPPPGLQPRRVLLRAPAHGADAEDPQRHAPGHHLHAHQRGRVPGLPALLHGRQPGAA